MNPNRCALLLLVAPPLLAACSSDEPAAQASVPDAAADTMAPEASDDASDDGVAPQDALNELEADVTADSGAAACGLAASGPGGGVEVAVEGSPIVLWDGQDEAQTVAGPPEDPMPWTDRGHMRRAACGGAGVLVLDTSSQNAGGAALDFVDLTAASPAPRLVVEGVRGCAGCQSLFFDAHCRAVVMTPGDGTPLVQLVDSGSGYWNESPAGLDLAAMFPGVSDIETRYVGSDVSADGTMHVFLEAGPPDAHELVHGLRGTDVYATWEFDRIGPVPSLGAMQYRIDGSGQLHALYQKTNYPCDPCDLSLYYGLEEQGAWVEEIVQQGAWGPPVDQLAPEASLFVDGNGEPWVAAWFQRRSTTGSLVSSELRLYGKKGGAWCAETVASEPDHYEGGDGPSFTGAQPQLLQDGAGRFHVLFSDYAQWHDADGNANYTIGQVRLAVRAGSTWTMTTLLAQQGPTQSPLPLYYVEVPTALIDDAAGGLVVTALERVWETSSIYNTSPKPVTFRALALRASIAGP